MKTREIPQTAVWGSFKCDLFICISLISCSVFDLANEYSGLERSLHCRAGDSFIRELPLFVERT